MSLSLEPPSCRSRSLTVIGYPSLLRADLRLSKTRFVCTVALKSAPILCVPVLLPLRRSE
jgi:hypothetical protein